MDLRAEFELSLAQILPLSRSGTTESLLVSLHFGFLSNRMVKVAVFLSKGCFED